MAWEITVAGSITSDDITTPVGVNLEQAGGSAFYFSIAASKYTKVNICGTVGVDRKNVLFDALKNQQIDLSCVDISDLPTARWYATHDFTKWVTAEEVTVQGAYSTWKPLLSAHATLAPVLFVGSMSPELQLDILEQSKSSLVGIDSMLVYISKDSNKVFDLISKADILFLNVSELCELTGANKENWQEKAQVLCEKKLGKLRSMVIKDGPNGATFISSDFVYHQPAPNSLDVVDPTGAGDALAGGFMGYIAKCEVINKESCRVALEEGVNNATDAILGFGASYMLSRKKIEVN